MDPASLDDAILAALRDRDDYEGKSTAGDLGRRVGVSSHVAAASLRRLSGRGLVSSEPIDEHHAYKVYRTTGRES